LGRDREERDERISGDRGRELQVEDLDAVVGAGEALDDVARDHLAVGAGAEAGLHLVRDQGLDLEHLAPLDGLGHVDEGVAHDGGSSTQAASVTITLALAVQNSPLLVSAMATIFCESLSLMRAVNCARPARGPKVALSTYGCGFFSLKTWIALT